MADLHTALWHRFLLWEDSLPYRRMSGQRSSTGACLGTDDPHYQRAPNYSILFYLDNNAHLIRASVKAGL